MKPSTTHCRKLRLRNFSSNEFRHLKLLLGWVGYLTMYVLTEKLIPPENCRSVHCALDDLIPFCEWFIIPYVSWYLLIAWSLGYFLIYSVDSFIKLQTYFIVTQAIAVAVYILFPTRQDLRPGVFPNENILTKIVELIYSVDTNTGVCPSLHVALSLGIASVWLREKGASGLWRTLVVIWVVLICISVTFVKQHSVVDILAAVPVCLAAEWFVFFRKRNPGQG